MKNFKSCAPLAVLPAARQSGWCVPSVGGWASAVSTGVFGSSAVGEAVGAAVGEPVGATVGTAVGVAAGKASGANVGEAVGAAVGQPVGATVGEEVGVAVGIAVGEAVGAAVGATVGGGVGAAVGVEVGDDVGAAVGELVGAAVGVEVGAAVGAAVGAVSPFNNGLPPGLMVQMVLKSQAAGVPTAKLLVLELVKLLLTSIAARLSEVLPGPSAVVPPIANAKPESVFQTLLLK